jgi:hypothetical protein
VRPSRIPLFALPASLLASDSLGNPQDLILDCGYWGAGMTRFEKYGPGFDERGTGRKHVEPTLGHINHIHIGPTQAGAARRTSVWSAAR